MKVTLFSDSWYHEMIQQQLNGCQDAGEDALAIASAIMCAGAFIAQAIDHSLGGHPGDKGTVQESLDRIADQLHRTADVYERDKEDVL